MAKRITYTDKEFEAFLGIRMSGEQGDIPFTKAALEQLSNDEGMRFNPREFEDYLRQLDFLPEKTESTYDPLGNIAKGESPPRLNKGKAIKHLELVANFILDELNKNTDAPFGISAEVITRNQWFALAQHKDGEANSVPNLHLTKYLCGLIRADGRHYYTVEAIYRKLLAKQENDTPVGINAEQKESLIGERIQDWSFNFEQTLAFVMGSSSLSSRTLAKNAGTHQPTIAALLNPETNTRYFPYEPIAKLLNQKNPLKLPTVAGEIDPEIHRAIRVKAWLRSVEIGRQFIPPSDNLIEAVLGGAKQAWEDYEAGSRTKAELPFAGEIIAALRKLSPTLDPLLRSYVAKLEAAGMKSTESRLNPIINAQTTPTPQELTQFCSALALQDAQQTGKLLGNLPFGQSTYLNHRHPDYIMHHPENYETFGKWMQAVRESKNLFTKIAADSLGVTYQALSLMELKESCSSFGADKAGKTWPERLLECELYGLPQDAEYRKWFLALSEPNLMKQQFEDPENWISREQLFKAVGLEWDRKLHDAIFNHYASDTEGLANGASGLVVGETYAMPVRRNKEGELRYHKSGIDMLKADPEIQEHLARQHNVRDGKFR